jgi:hypothetical protein
MNGFVTEFSNKDIPKDWHRHIRPSEAQTGQLRLVREGATVRFLIAAPPGGEFLEIDRFDYGTEEVSRVHFSVTDSGKPGNAVDVRLVDLKVRSPSAAAEQAVTAASTPETDGQGGSRIWFKGSLAILAIILMTAVAVWLYVRSRRGNAAMEAPVVDEG